MGTCNFWTMDDFDLVVMDDEKMLNVFLGEEFFEERKAEIEDYDPMGDIELAWELFKEDIDPLVDDLNDKLEWYNIGIKSGYYDGVQFYIDTEWLPIEEWDDDDCYGEFGCDKESTIEGIANEKKAINDFLDTMVKDYGFERIRCVGTFNSGEAVYEKVE